MLVTNRCLDEGLLRSGALDGKEWVADDRFVFDNARKSTIRCEEDLERSMDQKDRVIVPVGIHLGVTIPSDIHHVLS